jgi:MtaA/CmuA family methyltransferase
VLETFAAIAPEYKEKYLIMPGITGPYSQLVFMMGLENVLIMMYDDPDGLKEAIAKRVKHAISWLDDLIALGAETVWLGEGAASSSVISPACYAEFVAPYAKAVMDAAKERGIPCFMHVCGNIVPEIREIASTGCTAIDIDYMVPMDLVRQHCGEKACLKGNLNPVDLLTKTEEEVYQLCCQIYEETEGPMILGTGCLVAPKTPAANIDAMVRASKAMA